MPFGSSLSGQNFGPSARSKLEPHSADCHAADECGSERYFQSQKEDCDDEPDASVQPPAKQHAREQMKDEDSVHLSFARTGTGLIHGLHPVFAGWCSVLNAEAKNRNGEEEQQGQCSDHLEREQLRTTTAVGTVMNQK
jgi:hypothetical protein